MNIPQAPAGPGATRPPRTSIGALPVKVPGVVILGTFTAAVSLFALYGLWRFWPAPPPATGSAPLTAKFSYLGQPVGSTGVDGSLGG
jgi:hypothetical protein